MRLEAAPLRTAVPPRPAPSPAPLPSPVPTTSAFADALRRAGEHLARGEALVRRAVTSTSSGSDPSPLELLALQTGVYRYSEAVDLAAKVVERASSGVKTVLSGQ